MYTKLSTIEKNIIFRKCISWSPYFRAAKIMGKSGPVITMEVIKRAVFYHGLSKLIEEDSKGKTFNLPNI